MALVGTETVGDQMETPPSGDEKSEKVGNPFWSERAQEEAMVRSMRPSSLPDLNQVVEPGQSRTSTPTPLREALGGGLSGQDVGGLLQGVVEENEKLRRELEELKGISHPGGHGGQRGHGGDVPPALMSLLGRPTTTTGHWGVGGQVMQASNSQWSSEVSGMQAQGQVGRVASGVELLGQGVRINLTSMFERMFLTACGGAGHQASNPLQVQGQDRGHGGSMGLGSPQQMDQGHQVCYGGLQGQHLGGLVGQTQSAQPLEQGVHGSAAQKGKGYGWGCGSNPGGAGCGGQPSSGLSGFVGQGQAYGSQSQAERDHAREHGGLGEHGHGQGQHAGSGSAGVKSSTGVPSGELGGSGPPGGPNDPGGGGYGGDPGGSGIPRGDGPSGSGNGNGGNPPGGYGFGGHGGFGPGGPGGLGGPGGPPGPGGPGGPWNQQQGVPHWLQGLLHQQETVRTVDLPSLQELSESEIGPLIAGDWLCNIGPYMRDLSASSAGWWDLALRTAGEAYDAWINVDPMTKLRIQAVNPVSFAQSPWSRVEQRGSMALLKALPESIKQEVITSRDVGSVPILFRILKTYQPGGLAERSTLLRQLVE